MEFSPLLLEQRIILVSNGGGGGGCHSNLGCRDMFLEILSLLENCRSEGGKSVHFWKALCTGVSKIPRFGLGDNQQILILYVVFKVS